MPLKQPVTSISPIAKESGPLLRSGLFSVLELEKWGSLDEQHRTQLFRWRCGSIPVIAKTVQKVRNQAGRHQRRNRPKVEDDATTCESQCQLLEMVPPLH
jgi:hypothetical protein